ncbi:hypothetical protein RJT34_25298 [Clitoria ternatea]|uniref:F-box domain-containing protein n=1 Tax=Clitoria ternatea TaxID=43366 RepID=A0AAN9FS98_CLITE
MRLRLRSLESKETLKIEVPDSCSLHQLKHTISTAISSSSPPYLSLNRKDEIHASSPHDPLHSIGIAAGDLIFYSLNPNAFSLETLPHKPTPQEETDSHMGPTIFTDSPSVSSMQKIPSLHAAEAETPQVETDPHMGPTIFTDAPSVSAMQKVPSLHAAEAETVNTINGSGEASFVKGVLREALVNDVSDFKLLVLAVNAVILESGFVLVDHVSGAAVNCSHLLDNWPSASSSTISLRYTLPILTKNGDFHSVALKFQTLGHLVNVYGSLSVDTGSRLYRVCLDKCKFARPVELLMLAKSEAEGQGDVGDDHCGGNVAFELWMMVKDRLALPLLIDLCEKVGLDLPPCFMRLPMELKLMILERLPGVDLAKVGSTCSELRYLSSSNELWKKKIEEEFGVTLNEGERAKSLFAASCMRRKKSEMIPYHTHHPGGLMRYIPRRANPFGIHVPVWGGQYDMQPVFGVLPVYPHPPRWLSFIPQRHHHLREFNQ